MSFQFFCVHNLPFLDIGISSAVLVTLINVQSIDTVHASRLKVPLAAKDNTVLVVLPHTLHTGGASEVDVSIWSVETTSIVWSYRDTKGFGG